MSEGIGDLRETNEVTQLLLELKSRSGLSYGALAKALHLSTSTLHRYCNGDVMPAEFAPLESLARLCEATPEELIELYRLWVVADASRGNKASPAPEPMDPPTASRTEAAPDTGGSGDTAPGLAVTCADPDRVLVAAPRRRARRRGVLAAVTATAVLATTVAVTTGLKTGTASSRATDAGTSATSPGVHGPSRPLTAEQIRAAHHSSRVRLPRDRTELLS